MDSVRQTADNQKQDMNVAPLIKKGDANSFSLDCNGTRPITSLGKARKWNGLDKTSYGKLLLSYLMNEVDLNRCFIEHLAEILNKSCKEVNIFHRKMMSEHKSPNAIVRHVLRERT
jgi:hypothetical protein